MTAAAETARSLFNPARLEYELGEAIEDYKLACNDRRAGRATSGDVSETATLARRLRYVYAERYPQAFNYSAYI